MVTTVNIGSLIVATSDVFAGRPRINNKRFSVAQIAALTKEGLSPQKIVSEYNSLTLAEVHAALAYYYANPEQIEQYLEEDMAEYQKLLAQYKSI